MRLISRLVLVVFGGIAVLLAMANKTPVDFSLEPLPYIIQTPLFALLIAAFGLGFGIGMTASWWSGRDRRREARLWRRQEKAAAGARAAEPTQTGIAAPAGAVASPTPQNPPI